MKRYLPVDGLRAISVLWMIAFHTLFFTGMSLSREQLLSLASSPWLRIFGHGHFGVDIFFVISGFLIGSLLISEIHTTQTISLQRFYTRRFFRIFPIYLFVIVIYGLFGGPHFRNAWANLMMINNFLGIKEQFMAWTWSLAIEEQFYLLFPLLLTLLYRLSRYRLRILLLFLGLSPLIHAALLWKNGLTTPFQTHPTLGMESFARYFDAVYERTETRYGGILVGVIVALLAQEKNNLVDRLTCSRFSKVLLLIVLGTVAIFLSFPLYAESNLRPSPALTVAFLASYRLIFSIMIGYILLFSLALSEKPVPHWLPRFLSRRFWLPIAELSYGAYLLHPIVISLMLVVWPPGRIIMPSHVVGLAVLNAMLTFSLAYPLHRWIEAPCREFGRNLAFALHPSTKKP